MNTAPAYSLNIRWYTLDNGVVFMLNGREDISKNSNGDRTISFYPTLNGEPLDMADTEMEGDFVCFRTKKDDLCVGRNTLLPIYSRLKSQ